MGRLTDTSPEAQAVLTEAYRRLSPGRKLRILEDEFRLARRLFLEGELRRNPGLPGPARTDAWRRSLLGRFFSGGMPMAEPQGPELEPIAILRTVTAALDSLGIAYAVGGSWASGLYGEPRMTRDADLSVEPFPGKERSLAACFGPDFYVSVPAMEQANRDRFTFNIIYTPAAYKFDLFVLPDDGFSRSLMIRRARAVSDDPAEPAMTWVSAEDIVLLKLRWYRNDGEVSDRQWSDILGVLRVQQGRLDETHLDQWAADLGVSDFLKRARAERDESGPPGDA